MVEEEFHFSLCLVCIANFMKLHFKVKARGFAKAIVIIWHPSD